MPLDVGFSGPDKCPACNNTGMTTDSISNKEMQNILDARYSGAKVVYAHATRLCDCSNGERLRDTMKQE